LAAPWKGSYSDLFDGRFATEEYLRFFGKKIWTLKDFFGLLVPSHQEAGLPDVLVQMYLPKREKYFPNDRKL
jgi:hypothetical protein